MDKIAIIYSSFHHDNTKKVIEEMAKARKIDIIKLSETNSIDLSKYKYIGFASGIYFQKMNVELINFAKKINFSENQKTFIVYTCGLNYKNYVRELEEVLKNSICDFIGTFHCRGYDSFGSLKLIGGIAKKHPNEKDLKRAREFINSI